MREMKNSGVAWIGDVPENWEIVKIGQLFQCRNVKVNDTDFQPLSVSKGGIVPQMENVAKSDANDNRKQVLTGDFVINSRSDRKQSCGVSKLDGSVSLINTVLYGFDKDRVIPEYNNYLLKNYGFAEEFYRWGHGIVADLWTTRWQEMKNIEIPVPSIKTQEDILSALRIKSKNISLLIFNQEQQIEKLKQYKQSLITEVVTKGLNPDVPMKDSGVKWLGKIPNNWQTKKIKYVAKIIDDKYLKGEYNYIALENIESHSARFIKTDSVYDLVGTKMAYSDTVIFGKLRPYLAKVFLVKEITCVNNEFSVFKGLEVTNEYLKYFMLGSRFIDTVNASTYGTKMPRANIGFISNLQITIPPFQEQQNIANYLDDKCAKIDRLIAIKQEKINKLNDYKKSLIYEYVTGKKEA